MIEKVTPHQQKVRFFAHPVFVSMMLSVYCLQASTLPLSIIIVGIGGADFTSLYYLLSYLDSLFHVN